jgi:hypothetical protein
MSTLKADFDKARAKLAKIKGALNVGTNLQAQFAAQLEAAISAAGLQGWLDWTLDFQNMLVHRGRRFELGQYLPITPVLLGPDGQLVPRARRVAHLPVTPVDRMSKYSSVCPGTLFSTKKDNGHCRDS